jgi:ADP-dependent NAD(P)H-hydrate dehydratase / NAD(P)H-hydrate epimerase
MKVFEANQIREIDEYTIRNEPVASVDLMERAATGCANWISSHVQPGENIRIFSGPGNNGGDGWAIARLMAALGYSRISLYLLQISKIISADSVINRQRLEEQKKVPVIEISREADFPVIGTQDVIIDALFGSGLSRSLEGLSAALVNHINASGSRVIAIDIPSGLHGDDAFSHKSSIIKAGDTLSFEFPKRSFFYAENDHFVGNFHIIPIGLHPAIIGEKFTPYHYMTMKDIRGLYRKRPRFSHKGSFGHALLVAGSYGMMGAAILSARACLRSGVGLLTTHVPRSGYPILQAAVPESVFDIDSSDQLFSELPSKGIYSASGIGPGIGVAPATIKALESLLGSSAHPLVLDADALNILAGRPEMYGLLPPDTILTPHPGEFDRLAGISENGRMRNKRQMDFALNHKVIVILKGAFSSVAMPDGSCYFNSTGNPGMATGGSGDVLTGIILSLLAQGYPPADAALLGTYVHGYAGDLAALKSGQQALIASDIIDHIGKVFLKIENNGTNV